MYKLYLVYCLISHKIYVGVTSQTLKERWKEHIYDALVVGKNYHFYKAIRKYGPESFEMSLIGETETREEALKAETLYILLFNSTDRNVGYNSTYGGQMGNFTPEIKEKLRNSTKDLWKDPIFREKVTASLQGINTGKEHPLYRHDVCTEDIIREYEDCNNFTEVGRRLGIKYQLAVNRYYGARPEEKKTRSTRTFKYSPGRKGWNFDESISTEDIIKEYKDCGNFAEVGRRLGIPEVVAFKRYRKINPISPDKPYSHPFSRPDVTPDMVAEKYQELQNFEKVGQIFGITRKLASKKYKQFLGQSEQAA